MKKFDRFYFEGFDFDKKTLKARFFYSFDKQEYFTEEIDFSSDLLSIRTDFDIEILNNFLFSMSLALGISYYKLYPTKELVLESGYLDEEDTIFWLKFYRNGLGEFLFKNKISPNGLFNFVNSSDKVYKKIDFQTSEKSYLPIGGGKDSIVSAELLKKNNFEFTPIIFGKLDQIKQNCLDLMQKKSFLIKRKLDENLFKLNNEGYYNGHVPITGIIAFAMLTASYLYNYKYIVLSNEKSANSGNVKLEVGKNITVIASQSEAIQGIQNNSVNGLLCKNSQGQKEVLEVNHQYSKSLEFEQDLKNYIERNLSSDLVYFSLLRGLYEIKIAEIFSKVGKKYFGVFSSCNTNFKINGLPVIARYEAIQKAGNNIVNGLLPKNSQGQKLSTTNYPLSTALWCNSCPKCAFVYAILRPFISDTETIQIFSKELYQDKSLENLFLELLGIQGIKPFECVGEKEEVAYAMNKTIKKFKAEDKEIPYILQIFEKEILNKYDENFFKKEKEKLFKIYNEETLIPSVFNRIEL